jgi:hypothetical protein
MAAIDVVKWYPQCSHDPNHNPNPKQTQSKPKKKKNKDPSGGLEESGDEEVGGGRGRERKRELEIHVFRLDLSLYSGHRSCRAWVLARSIKPTYVHRRRFDTFGRIRPKAHSLQSRDPVVPFASSRSHRPSKSHPPFLISGQREEEERER